MITPATSRRFAPALLAVGLILTGCSGEASETAQTAQSAAEGAAAAECQGISAELQQVGDELGSLPGKIPADVPDAVATVESALSRTGGLADTVTDPELREKVSGLSTSLSDLQEQANNAADDPVGSAGALLDAVASARTAYNDLKAFCGM